MRSFARIVLIAFVCLAAAHTRAVADDAAKLVGLWHEYSPSDNLVNFLADGRVVMYLRKGEVGDLHTLEGKWSVAGNGDLTVTFAAMGKSVTQTTKLSFDGDEMVLTDEKGELTKHRRYTGPLPAWTQW
jgi:uncharacterized protein (TIGR03066 family)